MTAKKKTLIELMLDVGIDPEDFIGNYVVSDTALGNALSFYDDVPKFNYSEETWGLKNHVESTPVSSLAKNWKRTIITKQQFIDAYNEKHAIGEKTNIAEGKQVGDIEPCRVVDNRAYDCTTTDDSGISLPLVDVAKSKSDGSTASYYELPEGAKELQDLISHRDMNSQIGEVFRACYRYGLVEHSDKLRDAKKIKFYADAEIKRLEKLQGSK